MIDLLQWDEQVFYWINKENSNPILDGIMPYWRSKYFWLPLYVFIITFVLINFEKNKYFFFVALILTVATADTVSSKIIKPAVNRIRPCNDLEVQEKMTLRVHCGGGKSFPSSHATNHFAVAFFLSLTLGKFFKWIRLPLILWAGSIAYGQVYVGVHYPIDVLAGTLLGILLGTLIAVLYFLFPPLIKYDKS